jgi:hypothetical protein
MEHFANYANSELKRKYTVDQITDLLTSIRMDKEATAVQSVHTMWRALPERGRRYYTRLCYEIKSSNPRASVSPYICFCKENREWVKQTYGDLTFGQIGRMLGKLWAELPELGSLDY